MKKIFIAFAGLVIAMSPVFAAANYYVSTAGSDANAGTNWATAKQTIQAAVDSSTSGDTVWVTNGTYTLANQVAITKGITVRSVNGAGSTFVNGGWPASTNRCFYISATNAVLDGFTITNGHTVGHNTSGSGAGVNINTGTVQNCTISSNTSAYNGGGVSVWYGLVQNCIISGNSAVNGGGGISSYNLSGMARNCLIVSNFSSSGGGVNAGKIQSCTVVGNTASFQGGGLFEWSLAPWVINAENSIVYYNSSPDGSNWFGGTYTNSCSAPMPAGTDNIIGVPLFVDAAAGNYQLQSNSPCINVGINRDWMIDAVDLAGNARIMNGIVDMGAYEYGSGSVPSSAAGIRASDGTYTNKISVTWNTASGAAGYHIYRNISNSSDGLSVFATSTLTNYDDASVTVGTIYYYWVKATNAFGTSGFSASDSGYAYSATSSPSISAPTGFTASQGTYANKVHLSWNSVSNATSYEVWRNTSNSTHTATKLADATGAENDDTAVIPGITFYYWVKAKNETAVSDFSLGRSGYAAGGGSGGSADLALSNFILLPTALAAGEHPSVLAFLLLNYGPDSLAVLNTRVQYDFYLSANTTFGDSDDVWMGDCGVDQNLSAGTYTTVMLSESNREGVTIPSGLSGHYYVFVRVRHASPSTLSDPTESNNYAVRSSTIFISSTGTSQGYHPLNDFDGDGKSDMVLYHEASGYWYILQSTEGLIYMQFGGAGYRPVSGDYDGDGKSDLTVYDTASGYWFYFLSASLIIDYAQVGGTEYQPVCGDFDGDGKSDLSVYSENSGYWYVLLSDTAVLSGTQFGAAGYESVCGDFDGDGKTDLAVYQTSSGYWYMLLSGSDYSLSYTKLGATGYSPVPGDYDGDGKTDMAVYQRSTGYWFIFYSGSQSLAYMKFGEPGYEPVGGDFDGDGRRDLVVYNEATGYWYFLLSSSGQVSYQKFGEIGYEPVDCDYDLDDDANSIGGKINLNPNNSPDNAFMLTKTDGSTITRTDLTQDFAGYSGSASRVHVRPKGSGNQNYLTVDGQVYTLSNSKAYDIESDSMTVDLYNDKVNAQGKAIGQWWISITATAATITITD